MAYTETLDGFAMELSENMAKLKKDRNVVRRLQRLALEAGNESAATLLEARIRRITNILNRTQNSLDVVTMAGIISSKPIEARTEREKVFLGRVILAAQGKSRVPVVRKPVGARTKKRLVQKRRMR